MSSVNDASAAGLSNNPYIRFYSENNLGSHLAAQKETPSNIPGGKFSVPDLKKNQEVKSTVKVDTSSKKIFEKIVAVPKTCFLKGVYLPGKNFVKWYWNNLPSNILPAAAASTIYVFAIMLFFSGNPLMALVAGVALAGVNSLFHSLSMPFIKLIFLDKTKAEEMSIGLRMATYLLVGVITSGVFALLSIWFPPLNFVAEINLTFTVGMLLVAETVRVLYKVINKFVNINYSTLRASATISV